MHVHITTVTPWQPLLQAEEFASHAWSGWNVERVETEAYNAVRYQQVDGLTVPKS